MGSGVIEDAEHTVRLRNRNCELGEFSDVCRL